MTYSNPERAGACAHHVDLQVGLPAAQVAGPFPRPHSGQRVRVVPSAARAHKVQYVPPAGTKHTNRRRRQAVSGDRATVQARAKRAASGVGCPALDPLPLFGGVTRAKTGQPAGIKHKARTKCAPGLSRPPSAALHHQPSTPARERIAGKVLRCKLRHSPKGRARTVALSARHSGRGLCPLRGLYVACRQRCRGAWRKTTGADQCRSGSPGHMKKAGAEAPDASHNPATGVPDMKQDVVQKMDQTQEFHAPADPMVSMIERLVLNPDADLDKLERMLAMKERMDAQNARVSFSRALAQARAEIPPIVKDATVDFTSSKGRTHYRHETLAGIAKVIDPILSQHGISYRFRTDQGQGGVKVTCIVQHSDGHAEETTLTGAPDQSGNKNGFQAVGSAVTYLQRYTLKAALGLSAEVDDDAQSAAPREPEPRRNNRNTGPSQDAIDVAKSSLSGADTLDQLRAIWSDLPKPVQNVPAVIKAKDERKAALSAPDQKPDAPADDLDGDRITY